MSLMPQTPFQWFVPATTGTGLVPADGYKAKFYAAGTSTPKAIYTDPDLTVPYPSPSNTAILDAEGRALIYFGSGGYKLVITTAADAVIYTQDNISGEGAFGTGFVNTFADLAAVNTTLNAYTYIGGYYSPGDGGEGMFYNATSGTAGDGGYVIRSTFDVAKAWFRIPDENGDVRAASFGFCGAGVRTSNLQAADAYAASIFATLRIQKDVTTSATVTLASRIVFNSGAALNASGTATIVCSSNVEAGGWNLFSSWTTVTLWAGQETRPEWFGGSLSGTGAANATAFAKWTAAGGGVFVVPPGDFAHTGTFTPASGKLTIFLGAVTGSHIPGTYYGPASLINGNLSLTLTGTFGLTGTTTLTGALAVTGNASVSGTLAVSTISAVTLTINADVSVNGTQSNSGSLSVGGNLGVSGRALVTDEIESGSYVQAKAGTSASPFKASGRLYASTATASTSGTSETTLSSYPLIANSLAVDGSAIRVTGSGNAATGGARTIALKLSGGATLLSSAFTAPVGTSGWKVIADIVRTSSTTATISWMAVLENQALASPTSFFTVSITFASDNTFQFVGTAAGSGAIVQNMILVDFFPV